MSWFHNVKMSWFRVFQENRDGLVKSRRNLYASNLINTVISYLVATTFYTTLLLVLFRGEPDSLRNEYIGNIAILQTAASFLQMVAPLILERMRSRKKFIIVMRCIYHFLEIIGLGIVPLLPFGIIAKANIFMVICGLISAVNALYTPGMQAWHIYPVRNDIRSDYFALNSMSTAILANLVAMITGLILDAAAIHQNEYIIILAARTISIPLVVIAMRKWWKIAEPEYPIGEKRPSFAKIMTVPFRYPKYLINTSIAALWALGSAAMGSYYSAYILSDGGVSYTLISVTNLFGMPLTLIFTPIWNQVARKVGLMRLMPIGMFLYSITYAINGLVTKDTTILYLLGSVYCCSVAPAYSLGVTNLMFDGMPKEGQSTCVAFYSTLTSLLTFVGAWIGKGFMKITEGKIVHIFGLELTNGACISFLPFFFMVLTSVFAALVYWRKKKEVQEPEETVTM